MNRNSIIHTCPDCAVPAEPVHRREFLKAAGVATGAAVLSAGGLPILGRADDVAASSAVAPESVVKLLYDSLTETQRGSICHAWDYMHPEMGLLRARVSNNWQINDHNITSDFYTADQQAMIRQVFEGIIHPDWHQRIDKQLDDDAGGYGVDQSISIFGQPGEDKFEFVMTGRHMTIRCDGNSAEHLAFGGPIFYGHAASGFDEAPDHPGNVFWHQAVEASKVYEMLDGKQRKLALVEMLPEEHAVGFGGPKGVLPGIPLSELSADQVEQTQKVLTSLLEPYRQADRDEAAECLKAQGGLERCSLAFYRQGNLGDESVWDCWRLEGPSFVWYFRGSPHVHVWANVASDPSVKTNS